MRKPAFALISSALLGLLLACNGSGSGSSGGTSPVTVRAAFQKEVLNSGGGHSMTTLPARYCYVEFRDNTSHQVTGSGGFLDGNAQGTFQVPTGESAYAVVYAAWQIPGASSGSDLMQGEVVNASYGAAYNSTSDWYVTSDAFTASAGTLNVLALDDSSRIAGAFNIADQGVTFALGMKGLAVAALPNLAVYWTTSSLSSDQYRVYPQVVLDSSNNLILQNGHALFQAAVFGNASGAPNTEQDEWDDGTLGETYAHLLFAPYTFKADGSSALSYLRADTENVPFISLGVPAEPSQAFITGYADFLSAAFRNNPQILDSYRDGSGVLRVQNEDLSQPANLGEFSRYGVAGSLWSIWKQALGGGQSGLQALWNATLTSNSGLDFVGDYNGSPLGCYPTYLVGLRAAVGSSWPACQTAFGAWGVADPSATYFSTGSALWTNEAAPFTVTGATLVSPATPAAAALSYDRNGAALYRFTQGSTGTRTITLTPTGGQDFELDLVGPNGPVAYNFASPYGNARTLNPTLAPGSYAIRVRTNPDNTLSHAAGSYSYNLALN
ncbi:MAG TPA: hypothetical protein VFF76_05880 [Holophagaceae bacterium]|jgi:hypothetical protein|nr:hypothetical protein [Holophagaceae bacterium]